MTEVRLRTLTPGDGFGLALDFSDNPKVRPGFLMHLGAGSASVMLLEKVHREIVLSDGKKIPVSSVVGLQHWCLDTMVIPDGTKHDLEKFKNEQGEIDMATKKNGNGKTSKAKKAVKGPKEYTVTAYEPTKAADSEKGVKLQGKDTHDGVILKFLCDAKGPQSLAQIMDGIGEKSFGSESKNVKTIFAWHVHHLIKNGFVKSVDEKVEATSAQEARESVGA